MTWLTPAVNGPREISFIQVIAGTSTVSLVLSATPFWTSAGGSQAVQVDIQIFLLLRGCFKSALPFFSTVYP